ncbi:glycoside hydrolase [Nitrosomonas sp.]|uniref:glycoside hydrolase n=1 Tax=Nitrosomonas sp. TaxID=42353 RepID=UPI00374D705C
MNKLIECKPKNSIKLLINTNSSTVTKQNHTLLIVSLFFMRMALVAWIAAFAASAVSAPVSGPVKWHPGHYYDLMGSKNNSKYMAQVYKELKNTPALRGVQIRYTWAELETSYGVYNFTSIDKNLAELATQNKRLIILLQIKAFDPNMASVPEYLKAGIYDEGIFSFNNGGSTIIKGHNIKLWNSNVRDRLVALVSALGTRFNSHPYFEGIGLTETSMGVPIKTLSSTQEDDFYSNLSLVNKKMREFFPNTMTFQFTNYPRSFLKSFIENLSAIGTGLGGPDTFIEDPGLNHPGDKHSPSGVYSYYPKLSGIIPLTPSVMQSNYANTRWDKTGREPTVLELLTFARDKLKANYIFWTRAPGYYPKVLLMLNESNQTRDPVGGLDPNCPKVYNSCID